MNQLQRENKTYHDNYYTLVDYYNKIHDDNDRLNEEMVQLKFKAEDEELIKNQLVKENENLKNDYNSLVKENNDLKSKLPENTENKEEDKTNENNALKEERCAYISFL